MQMFKTNNGNKVLFIMAASYLTLNLYNVIKYIYDTSNKKKLNLPGLSNSKNFIQI